MASHDLSEAVRHICRHAAAQVGPQFFAALVQDLATVLDCDDAFVGELSDSGDAIETLAVWSCGAPAANMRYELRDTPCEQVVGQEACVHADDVTVLFPNDPLLIDMDARGYVGVPVYSADGAPSGILVALYRKPVPSADFAKSVISLFAGRTGAELDRLRAVRRADTIEAQAVHAQKLESLGVLAGGLAHDFNNVLSSILGSSDLARLVLPADHEAHEHLSTIQEAAATAAGLCRQLLAYAGKGRFRIEDLHISDLVRDQEQLLRASTSADVTLRMNLVEDAEATARLDRSQIGQILLNLVINASEAIAETGRAGLIRITTGVMECDAAYLRTTYLDQQAAEGRYVFLEVSDNGPGMTEDVLERLFDPFFTTKFTGRGLGLAAILGIVRSHGGTIKVYSEVGSGSSFKIFFPISDAAREEEEKTTPQSWRGSGTVLLVDDNPSVRRVGARMLRALGFEALTAEDGVDAVDIVTKHTDEIDVVILDLTMPRMSGKETFREIRKLRPALPIILTSGFNEQDTVQHFVEERLAGFLQKPFQLRQLQHGLRIATETSEPRVPTIGEDEN